MRRRVFGRSDGGGDALQKLHDESHSEADNENGDKAVEEETPHEVHDAEHYHGLEEVLAIAAVIGV